MTISSLKAGDPVNSNLGLVVDEYHEIRDLRLAMQKEVDAVAAREKELRDHLVDNIAKSDVAGVVGQSYKAIIVSKAVVLCTNWGAFHSWVRENDRFDMIQKRLSDAAVKDYIEQVGTVPPGVEQGTVPDVSITKI